MKSYMTKFMHRFGKFKQLTDINYLFPLEKLMFYIENMTSYTQVGRWSVTIESLTSPQLSAAKS